MQHGLWSSLTSTILSYLLSSYNSLSFFEAIFLILENTGVLISWKGLALQNHVDLLFKLIYLTQAL